MCVPTLPSYGQLGQKHFLTNDFKQSELCKKSAFLGAQKEFSRKLSEI